MNIEYDRIYNHDIDLRNKYVIYTDKMYPRGLSDTKRIKNWIKGLAPTMKLIKWFHQNTNRWPEFKKKYLSELSYNYKNDIEFRNKIQDIIKKGKKKGNLLILYSSKNEKYNNARVFGQFIKRIMSKL